MTRDFSPPRLEEDFAAHATDHNYNDNTELADAIRNGASAHTGTFCVAYGEPVEDPPSFGRACPELAEGAEPASENLKVNPPANTKQPPIAGVPPAAG